MGKKKSLKSYEIENIIDTVVDGFSDLKIKFKNETFLSQTEDEEFEPQEKEEDRPTWDELYHDEDENETYDCQLTFPTGDMSRVVEYLTKEFGTPSEMRKDPDGTESPVWKYGKKDRGQVWVYRYSDEYSYVDTRYYYVKS